MKHTDGVVHLLEQLGLDEAAIASRKAFLDFAEDDVERLAEFHQLLEESGECAFFVEEFYRHLLAFPETARFISDTSVLARLRASQAEYFHSLTAGAYGPEYVRHRLRVGLAHERIGLAPQWYLGAYSKYLVQLVPKVRELYAGDDARAQPAILALLKIVFFDMDLAIETYIHAKEQAIRAKVLQLETLNQIAVSITSSMGQDEILNKVMRAGMELTGAMASCVAFFDPATTTFDRRVAHGLSERFVENLSFRPNGLAEEVFAQDGIASPPAVVASNDRPQTRHKLSDMARAEGIRGFVCLPLVSHASRLGVIYFYRGDRDTFTPDEISLLRTFASLSAGAIEEARLRDELGRLARTDPLTGLLNRRVFDRRLEEEHRRAQRYGKRYAMVMMDIDHFKRVNDDYGHQAGDAVLKALGGLLTVQFRDVDIVARYGGEEFVAIMPEIDGPAARHVAERLRAAVATAPFTLPDGREIAITISIGVACFPQCAESMEAVVACADRALYDAKDAGRNRVVLYRATPTS